jgi:Trehalose and maltose hydrolases (possible phosphorylases)
MLFVMCILLTVTNAWLLKNDDCLESKTSTATCIVTNSLPLADDGKKLNYRNMPSIGNGYLGTVVMSDEIHISGVFNGRANVTPDKGDDKSGDKDRLIHKHTHRARISSPVAINYTKPEVHHENRTYFLDILNGLFVQRVESTDYTLQQRSYSHRSLKHVLVTEITVESDLVIEFDVVSNMGPRSSDINFKDIPTPYEYNIMFGYINQTETSNSQNVSVAVVYTKIPRKTSGFGIFTKAYITAVSTSLDSNDPVRSATQYYQQANDMFNKNTLYATHSEAWKQVWSHSNITINNNLYLLQTVYTSLYYIFSSVREDWKHGLSPGGLPMGYEYLGHTFWDQETWMYPPILMFHPEIAKSLLDYRFERLEAAQEIAKRYKFKGLHEIFLI